MKLHFILVPAALSVVLFASTAGAQSSYYLGVGSGQAEATELDFQDFDDGSGLSGSFDDSDSGWKVLGGYQFSKYFALELAYVDLGTVSFEATSDGSGSVYNSGPVTGSVSADGPNASAIGIIPIGNRFEVLVKAGFTAWKADSTLSNSAFGDAISEEDGTDISYGLGARFKFNDRFAIRGEFERFTEILDRDGQLISLSAQLSFGKKEAPMSMPTMERDGDADNDGVADSQDSCPNTRADQNVDTRGCPRDGDGDGVSDDQDHCPGTFGGATVDINGCEMDGDADRVVDRMDECPNSRPDARVDVKGCEIREIINLPGVNFESNSDQLLAGSEQVLADAAETLKMNPNLIVEVAGHTDSAGNEEYNEGLSERRAITVRDYLVEGGVNPANLTARGYGEAAPQADNATDEGRARNRRVELRIENR